MAKVLLKFGEKKRSAKLALPGVQTLVCFFEKNRQFRGFPATWQDNRDHRTLPVHKHSQKRIQFQILNARFDLSLSAIAAVSRSRWASPA